MLPLYFQDCFIIFVALTRHAVSAYTINFIQEVAVHRFLFFVQLQIYDFYSDFLYLSLFIQLNCG